MRYRTFPKSARNRATALRPQNTIVRRPSTITRSSRCSDTARASTRRSTSRPTRSRSCALWRWSTRTTSPPRARGHAGRVAVQLSALQLLVRTGRQAQAPSEPRPPVRAHQLPALRAPAVVEHGLDSLLFPRRALVLPLGQMHLGNGLAQLLDHKPPPDRRLQRHHQLLAGRVRSRDGRCRAIKADRTMAHETGSSTSGCPTADWRGRRTRPCRRSA